MEENVLENTITRPKKRVEVTAASDAYTALVGVRDLIKLLRGKEGRGANREESLAITHLQEAGHWLMESLGMMPEG